MADGGRTIGITPDVWFLVFHETSPRWWLNWLAMGRFKHVSAIGWVPGQRVWLIYDVRLNGTLVAVLPDCPESEALIADHRAGGVTLAVAPKGWRAPWFRLGFWCVPAISHLIGYGCALRPDALYRECLRNGAQEVDYGRDV